MISTVETFSSFSSSITFSSSQGSPNSPSEKVMTVQNPSVEDAIRIKPLADLESKQNIHKEPLTLFQK